MRIATACHQIKHGNVTWRGRALWQQPQLASHLFGGIVANVFAVEPDGTGLRLHQAAKSAQQGRFTAGIRPDNDRQFTVRNRNGKVARDDFFVIAERQVFGA
ncbi:hypothetical protein D3C72_1557160 [compost metagenome]